jgi:hypothetical protein
MTRVAFGDLVNTESEGPLFDATVSVHVHLESHYGPGIHVRVVSPDKVEWWV